MNVDLISKSLCFHGQPLQKIWDGERGNNDLSRLGIINADYSIYTERQKNLTFQDRAKRLKLHQFIARNAHILFDGNLIDDIPTAKRKDRVNAFPVVVPPYEAFLGKTLDKSKYMAEILELIQPGDIIYGQVMSRTGYGIVVKVLCTGEPLCRYLADIAIKAYVVTSNLVPAHDKKGNSKTFSTNDFVCCEVLDLSADADRMVLGMKGALTIDAKAPLGLITAEQLPEYYKVLVANENLSLADLLEKSKAFQNPNCVDLLFQESGLDPNEMCTHLSTLKHRFPQQEYAMELRQIQASKWAFRSVADGIEHFKVGRHSEAFQCLNKALNIDPRNVEGLVARGALYANSGSFKKAVEDFETALKLNPYHANARKYMGETLVALGRSYEEENRFEDARKAYMDCLNIIPHHEDAKSSLEFLNNKMTSTQSKQLIDASELSLPDVDRNETLAKKDKKKKKHGKRKNISSSSSSNSSDSDSNSSDTSSSSESSTTTSDSDSSDNPSLSKNKKKNRHRKKSLSPISKRMALMEEQNSPSNATRYNFNQPFHLANVTSGSGREDYDTKVRSFLNVTQEDEDYETRVRRLIEKASKHRKDRKVEEKSKKKEKKKQKKMKKENKKDKNRKNKSKTTNMSQLENIELKEALKILKSLPATSSSSKSVQDDIKECQKYEQIVDLLQKRKDLPSTSKEPKMSESIPRTTDQRADKPQGVLSSQNAPRKPVSPAVPPAPSVKRPTTPPPPPPIVERPRLPAPIQITPVKHPVVLDKFGSFRLAAAFEDTKDFAKSSFRRSISASPRRRYSRSPRSRSRTPKRYRRRSRSSSRRSISRRRSRTPRRRSRSPQRRSRSNSIHRSRSRSFVRSRSRPRRSYSRTRRSRSRSVRRRYSRSPIRRRTSRSRSYSVDRRWRSSRSNSNYSSRSGSRSPDSTRRGGTHRRRGGGGGYRGSRGFGRGFRGRGGRGVRRGGGGFRGGRRSPFRRHSPLDNDRRSGSKGRDGRNSDQSDNERSKRKGKDRNSDGIDGKWTHDKYEKSRTDGVKEDEEDWDDEPAKTNDCANDGVADPGISVEPSVEEIDKIIDQAQKERKEEILQRDKDLLKKPTPTNLPF